jgi:hypothetical protein
MSSHSKSRTIPPTVRKTLIVSGADPDLKKWLWENRTRSGEVLRAALRAELLRRGEITALADHPADSSAAEVGNDHPKPASQPAEPVSTAPGTSTAPPARPEVEAAPPVTTPAAAPPVAAPSPTSGEWLQSLTPDQLNALLALSQQVVKASPAAAPAPEPPPHDPAMEQLLSMGFG